MNYLLHLNSYARLAIFLFLSLCAHLAILFALSWSSFGARQTAHHEQHGKSPLTVVLPGTQPTTIQSSKKSLIEKTVAQDSTGADADTDKAGNKFSLSEKGLSLAIDQHYFGLAELDERPFVIQDIPGDPPELQDFPQGGKLILRLWINEEGKVINAEPVSSELPKAFIDSARNGFLISRFAPGRIRGNAVGTVMDIVLNYAPRE
ncbi:MAG TPA: hypothetical protein VFF26_01905 [Gallionella sp.]|nr:hypothetical protein [Gallionella sp.]